MTFGYLCFVLVHVVCTILVVSIECVHVYMCVVGLSSVWCECTCTKCINTPTHTCIHVFITTGGGGCCPLSTNSTSGGGCMCYILSSTECHAVLAPPPPPPPPPRPGDIHEVTGNDRVGYDSGDKMWTACSTV